MHTRAGAATYVVTDDGVRASPPAAGEEGAAEQRGTKRPAAALSDAQPQEHGRPAQPPQGQQNSNPQQVAHAQPGGAY